MTLSDTQRLILTQAAEHPAGLAMPPYRYRPCPAPLKAGLVVRGEQGDKARAPLAWKLDGEQVLLVITEAGRQTLAPAAAESSAAAAEDAAKTAQAPSSSRQGLRAVAAALLTAWDAEGDRDALAAPIAGLRALLAKPTAAPRSPLCRANPGRAPPPWRRRNGSRSASAPGRRWRRPRRVGRRWAGIGAYRPMAGPSAAAAAVARREAAKQVAHRLMLEVARLRGEGVVGQAGMARALVERGVPTPSGGGFWTHTTVARVLARAAV